MILKQLSPEADVRIEVLKALLNTCCLSEEAIGYIVTNIFVNDPDSDSTISETAWKAYLASLGYTITLEQN